MDARAIVKALVKCKQTKRPKGRGGSKEVRMLSIMEERQVVGKELGSQLENQSDPSVLQRRSCHGGHS